MLELSPATVYSIHAAALGATILLIRYLERWSKSILATGLQLSAIGFMAAFTFAVSEPPRLFEDFREAYYAAGLAVLNGPDSLIVQLQRGVEGFVNLPIVAYLFAPFALLQPKLAAVVFAVVGLASILLAWWMLCRALNLSRFESLVLLALFAACGPLHNSLKEGNASHIVLAFLVGMLWAVKRRRELIAGVLFACAALIKLPLSLLGVYFVFRRRWRLLSGAFAAGALVATLSLLVFGWAAHKTWYTDVLVPYSSGQVLAFNVQSMQAFVGRFSAEGSVLWDWNLYELPLRTRIVVSIFSVVLLCSAVASAYALRESRRLPAIDVDFSYALIAACVLSPLSWSHYYAWLLVPVAILAANLRPQRNLGTYVTCGSIAMFSWPIVGPSTDVGSRLANLFASHLFISALLLGVAIFLTGRYDAGELGHEASDRLDRPS